MSSSRSRRLKPLVRPGRPLLPSLALLLGTASVFVMAGLVNWSAGEPGQASLSTWSVSEVASAAAEGDVDDTADPGATLDQPVPLPLVAVELLIARDPFEPVVPEPEPETDASTDPIDPDDPNGSGDPSVPGQPTDPDGPNGGATNGSDTSGNGTTGATNGGCTGTTEVVCDGRVITVIEVLEENGEPVAVLQVDAMRYRVRVGDNVVDLFEVVSISPERVRLLYGDRVVTVEVGDNALK